MPDVVIIDGSWKSGDAIDTASRLTSDPEFDLKCRVVVLSSDSSDDYMMSAAQAGVAEVLSKPVDMKRLLSQLQKHANKLFVPPPADISKGGKGGAGYFEISVTAGDPSWSLPILENLLGEESLDDEFVESLLAKVGDEVEGVDDIDAEAVRSILRTAFDTLILDATEEHGEGEEAKRISKLEEALDAQAERLEAAIEGALDPVLDEVPDEVALLTEDSGLIPVDPDAISLTVNSLQLINELLWEVGIPGRLADTTLATRVEDAVGLTRDAIESLEPYLQEDED